MAESDNTATAPQTQVSRKTYLGDGVYVDYDGYGLVLTTNGISITNTVYLEPNVYEALTQYVAYLTAQGDPRRG